MRRTPCSRAWATRASWEPSADRPTELERAGGARHDVERLRADGARGAEDQQPLHRLAIVAAAFSAPAKPGSTDSGAAASTDDRRIPARRAGRRGVVASARMRTPAPHPGDPDAEPAPPGCARRPADPPPPARSSAAPRATVAALRAARRRAGDRVRARRGLLPVGTSAGAGTSTRCSSLFSRQRRPRPGRAGRRGSGPGRARSPTRRPGTARTCGRSSSRERIAGLAPGDLDRVFFTSGGSESVETALKLARAYHRARGEPTRVKVIAPRARLPRHDARGLSVTGLPVRPHPVRAAPARRLPRPPHGPLPPRDPGAIPCGRPTRSPSASPSRARRRSAR